MPNLGASLGTALAGSILIGGLTASFIQGIQENPAIPRELFSAAKVELASGIPFVSDANLEEALVGAGVEPAQIDAVVETNASARIDGLRVSFAILSLVAVLALFLTGCCWRSPSERRVVRTRRRSMPGSHTLPSPSSARVTRRG